MQGQQLGLHGLYVDGALMLQAGQLLFYVHVSTAIHHTATQTCHLIYQ